jgi:integrase
MESSRNPGRVRVRRTPPPTLTAEQIDRVIATANANPRLRLTGAVVRVLSETGLRSSELLRLRMGDVDFNNNRLFVSGSKTAGRYIPLTPQALSALQDLHSLFLGSDLVMGDTAVRTLSGVSENFRKITAQHGIVGQGLFSLRLFYVKHLFECGVNVVSVARSIGMSHPERTLRLYWKYGLR